jgi:hypothetical protein
VKTPDCGPSLYRANTSSVDSTADEVALRVRRPDALVAALLVWRVDDALADDPAPDFP